MPSELDRLTPLAEALFSAHAALQTLPGREPQRKNRSAESALVARTALALADALAGDVELLARLDVRLSGRSLVPLLLDLPTRLSLLAEPERAIRVAQAFAFSAPDKLNGDIALFHAAAGDREQALAQVAANLETATDRSLAEAKAGDVYRALGEHDAAEAYYQRALAEADGASARAEALLRITSLLLDTGRELEASALLGRERSALAAPTPPGKSPLAAAAGRNQPCPCGSGKKYKRCHGASR